MELGAYKEVFLFLKKHKNRKTTKRASTTNTATPTIGACEELFQCTKVSSAISYDLVLVN
jgi:hypothetical protein